MKLMKVRWIILIIIAMVLGILIVINIIEYINNQNFLKLHINQIEEDMITNEEAQKFNMKFYQYLYQDRERARIYRIIYDKHKVNGLIKTVIKSNKNNDEHHVTIEYNDIDGEHIQVDNDDNYHEIYNIDSTFERCFISFKYDELGYITFIKIMILGDAM